MSFKISIINGVVKVLSEDEVPETDITNLLKFDENCLMDLYRDHAAIQARWEQIAINLKNTYESFVEDFEKKWWAHNKQFSKFYLTSLGEKTSTVDSIRDTTILIYSKDTSEFSRLKYLELAFESANSKKSIYKDQSLDDFAKEMYKYISSNPAWYFEILQSTVKNMEKDYLTVQNIAKRLESRSFHMKEFKDLYMPKSGNAGPINDYNKDLEKAVARGYFLRK